MNILYGIIEFAASFVEIFVAYLVLLTIFKDKRIYRSLHIDILMTILGVGIVLACNKIALFSYFTILIVGLYLSLSAKIIYRVNLLGIFAVTSFYLICMNTFDFMMLTLISYCYQGTDTLLEIISGMGAVRATVISVIKILWLLVFILTRRFLQKFSVNIKGASLILITSIIGFCGFIYLANQAVKAFHPTMPIFWFIITCLLALIVVAIYFIMMRREEQIKIDFLQMRNDLLTEKYDSLNDIYMSNSKLFHDLNNHLNVLYQLLNSGDMEDAKEYIKEISKPILSLSKIVWTGVDVVDVVINSKLQKMNELKIASQINVEFPKNSNIHLNDLCTILSNLLDNSIEAANRLNENKYIALTMRRVNYFLFIKVENSCNPMKEFDVVPSTTKENKTFHGWGLQSVGDIVEKYNGTLECTNDELKFIVKIMLAFDEK